MFLFWIKIFTISSSTFIAGLLAHLIIQAKGPWVALLGGSLGAGASSAIIKKKDSQESGQDSDLIFSPSTLPESKSTIPENVVSPASLDVQAELTRQDAISVSDSLQSEGKVQSLEETVVNPINQTDSDLATQSVTEETVSVGSATIPGAESVDNLDAEHLDQASQVKNNVAEDLRQGQSEETGAEVSVNDEQIEGKQVNDQSVDQHPVVIYLENQGLTVVDYVEPRPSDLLYDECALYLGDNYSTLSPVFGRFIYEYKQYDASLKELEEGRSGDRPNNAFFHIFAKETDPSEKKCVINFFNCLKRNTLIASCRWSYKNKNQLIVELQKNRDIEFREFTDGFWFERYVCKKIEQIVEGRSTAIHYLRDIKVKNKGTGQDNEIDLAFLLDNKVLWVECTTGKRGYARNIAKYAHGLQQILKLPAEQILFVILSRVEIPGDRAAGISDKWGITVANEMTLEGHLRKALL